MDALGIMYAVICVMAWGSWLVPSEKVKFPNEQAKTFFVALASVIIAALVVVLRGEMGQLASATAWLPVIGGLIFSTLLTLIIIPVLYGTIIRKSAKNHRFKVRKDFTFMETKENKPQ